MSSRPPALPRTRPSPTTTFAIKAATDGNGTLDTSIEDDDAKTAALSPEDLAAAAADRAASEGSVPAALDALIESLGSIRARLGADGARPSTVTLGDDRADELVLELHAAAARGAMAAAGALVHAAGSLLGASRAMVFLARSGELEPRPLSTWGEADEDTSGARQIFRRRLMTRALEDDGVVYVELLGERGRAGEHATLLSLELSAALACGVREGRAPNDAPIGVLYVEASAASGRALAQSARSLAQRLAAHGGVALSNATRIDGAPRGPA
jgi:hypothetical protein